MKFLCKLILVNPLPNSQRMYKNTHFIIIIMMREGNKKLK